MVQIDKESCIACGDCVSDCVTKNIKLGEDSKAAVLGKCMQCGHCVAICPTKAVSITDYPSDDITEYDKDTFSVDPQNMLNMIKFRRSIRKFKDKLIEKDKLTRIIDAGRFTETASNSQQMRFIVIQDNIKEIKEMIWESYRALALLLTKENDPRAGRMLEYYDAHKQDYKTDRLFFNAPAMIIVTAKEPIDGGLASANIENMAVAEGLGVMFDGYVVRAIENSETVKERLDIGSKQIMSCMLIGYPDVTYRRTAPRKKADVAWE